ncbi:MAG: carboxypeptidase-like regulatory domain-containing protein [Flavobacteriaceae bacterium]
MFKHKAILLFIFCGIIAATNSILGQAETSIPNERTYVHTNATLLFPGDYLYYKCYVQRLDTKKLSDLSKMVYVELINEEREIIFHHKLFLHQGLAHGDFFIDQSLSSGNYKLIAYTQWMKNLGSSVFFQQDISIINPYTNDQKGILKSDTDTIAKNDIAHANKTKIEFLKLSVDNNKYAPRSKATLVLEGLTEDVKKGSYSISIKQKQPDEAARSVETNDFNPFYGTIPKENSLSKSSFLPELRGELLVGTVLNKETSQPIENTRVTLSALGQETLYTVATTNKQGEFYFSIAQPYDHTSITLRPLDNSNHSVKVIDKEKNDYSKIEFFNLRIDSTLKATILDKSVHNQIENAFSAVKPDSISIQIPKLFFDDEYLITYHLDDYTRFPTFKKTVQEIISYIGVKRINGEDSFSVRTPDNVLFNAMPSIALLDGFLIDEHSKLSQLNAREIEKVQVFTSNFINNGAYYKGAIFIDTKDMKDAISIKTYSDDLRHTLAIPQKRKKYFSPNYTHDTEKNNSIPDFRYQLLWHPDFSFSDKKNEIEFFTSDLQGTFEISLEGFTYSGKPVSLKNRFTVGD